MKKVIEASASYPNAARSQPNLLTLFFLITKLIIINTDVIGSQIENLALERPVASYIGHYNQSNFLIIRCMSAARYNIMRRGIKHY